MAESKSKLLIIGVAGKLRFELAKANLKASHRTLGLVRQSAYSDPNNIQKLQLLTKDGLEILKVSSQDEHSLMEALKQVDVVICAVASKQVLDQKP